MIVRVMIMEREFQNDEFCGKKSLISRSGGNCGSWV
jgi:hypothetical protein